MAKGSSGNKQFMFRKGYDFLAFIVSLYQVVTEWVNPDTKELQVGGRLPNFSNILAGFWNNAECWQPSVRGRLRTMPKIVDGAIAYKDGKPIMEKRYVLDDNSNPRITKKIKQAVKQRWMNTLRVYFEAALAIGENEDQLVTETVGVVDKDGKPVMEEYDAVEKIYDVETKTHTERKYKGKRQVQRPLEETDRLYREILEQIVLGKQALELFPNILWVGYKTFPDLEAAKERKANKPKAVSPAQMAARLAAQRRAEFNQKLKLGLIPQGVNIDDEVVIEDTPVEEGYSIAELRKMAGMPDPTPPSAPATPPANQPNEPTETTSEQVLTPNES